MITSSNNYRTVIERFEAKKSRAEANAEAKLAELHAAYPELAKTDKALSRTALDLLAAALDGKDAETKVSELRRQNVELTERRRRLFADNGIPEGADEPKYDCPVCKDTGYTNGYMCACLRRALIEENFRSSGIGELISTQNFDSFSTDYYRDDPDAFEAANDALLRCRKFADGFSPATGKNLLLAGATGLGKTHLSTSVAKTVIERGFDVVYESAQNIFRAFEKQQFGRREDLDDDATAPFFECDLLIIDDLGTELTNTFTVSCLYNLINTRINRRAPMIVNTNLTPKELRQRYEDRITSRLFGEFDILLLKGKDVRFKKRS